MTFADLISAAAIGAGTTKDTADRVARVLFDKIAGQAISGDLVKGAEVLADILDEIEGPPVLQ